MAPSRFGLAVVGDPPPLEPDSPLYARLEKSGDIRDGRLDSVGFFRVGPGLLASMPKAYTAVSGRLRRDDDFRLRHLFLLVRLLVQFRRDLAAGKVVEGTTEVETSHILDEDGGLLEALEAAAELRRDFLRNGLYYVKSVRRSPHLQSSPVDWPTTLKNDLPILGSEEVFHAHPVRRRRTLDREDFFHRLHATVVSDILSLTGEPETVPESAQLDQAIYSGVSEDPELFLEPYERRIYRDRGRRLVTLIRSYLAGLRRDVQARPGRDLLFCRIPNFEFVWEHMVRSVLGNDEGARLRKLPYGQWTEPGGNVSLGIGPRIDFARAQRTKDGSRYRYLCVFDAKDRPIDPSSAMTATANDVYKQVIYAQLMDPSRADKWGNFLLFPSMSLSESGPSRARVVGHHAWREVPTSHVFEVSVDFETAAAAYLREHYVDPERVVRGLLDEATSLLGDRNPPRATPK